MLRKFRKEIAKNTGLKFPIDMYNNIYGSVVVCASIFQVMSDSKIKEVRETWKNLKRNPSKIDFAIDDEKFIEKTLKVFNLEIPETFPIAFVQNGYNALFAPYVNEMVLPLREDGVKGQTLQKGKIYPINFEKENKENDNK